AALIARPYRLSSADQFSHDASFASTAAAIFIADEPRTARARLVAAEFLKRRKLKVLDVRRLLFEHADLLHERRSLHEARRLRIVEHALARHPGFVLRCQLRFPRPFRDVACRRRGIRLDELDRALDVAEKLCRK